MKRARKLISLIVALLMIIGLSACGGNEGGNTGKTESNNPVNNEEYFEWDGNIIIALTDEGAKQKNIVIPERCEGFNGMIFADRENAAISVSFESNKDLDLNGVFTAASNLKEIELPTELSVIGAQEFWICTSLERIEIPAGVSVIGANAFQDNTSLTEVVIKGEITSIEQYAFDGCTALTKIDLPNSVSVIEKYAFYECTALTEITLSKSLSEVGEFAFANSGITAINVPAEVELTAYANTAFVQADHEITVNVEAGSWMDLNFESVFDGAFVKNSSN